MTIEPGACRHCDIPERGHYRQIASAEQGGLHVWQPPTEEQIKARMIARRAARHPVTAVDLDDTSECPTGGECAVCGVTRQLGVAVFKGGYAPYCATVCVWCAEAGFTPPFTVPAEAHAAAVHCTEHCGLEPADIAPAVLAAELAVATRSVD